MTSQEFTNSFILMRYFHILLKQQQLETFQKVKAVVMFAFAEAILFGLCITGKSFDDMVSI